MQRISPVDLLLSMAYAADMDITGCSYHSWKMSLAAHRLSKKLTPQYCREVFHTALMMDVWSTGTYLHSSTTAQKKERGSDPLTSEHADRGANMIKMLPGMGSVSVLIRSHHNWGRGLWHKCGVDNAETFICQILSIIDTASRAGIFSKSDEPKESIESIRGHFGKVWSKKICDCLCDLFEDTEFIKAVTDPDRLPEMIVQAAKEVGIPSALDTPKGLMSTFITYGMLVDLKDSINHGHSMRVAHNAGLLAQALDLPPEDIKKIYWAGILHDCGKLGLSSALTSTNEKFDAQEKKEVHRHAEMTIRALTCIPNNCLSELAEVAGHDHERYDGNGYPDRLKGEEIPFLSRILSVVDAFDVMTVPTGYRMISPRAALLRLHNGSGSQFDPRVVETMESILADVNLSENLRFAA